MALSSSNIRKAKDKITKASPRPYQVEAIRKVVAGLKKSDRGRLIMPCGSGKTLVALWIAERLGMEAGKATLFVVPSLHLMSQTIKSWTANSKASLKILGVCSDKDVTGGEEIDGDVTSDPGVVAALLMAGTPGTVIFSTYQSLDVVAQACSRLRKPKIGLALADEAHRTAGDIDKHFSIIHDRKLIRAERRLYMTATPTVASDRDDSDDEVSMDDEEVFGPEFHRMSFGEAIELGCLSDYKLVVVGVNDKRASKSLIEIGGKSDAWLEASAAALARTMTGGEFPMRKVLAFNSEG